jgi:hypothetical protein
MTDDDAADGFDYVSLDKQLPFENVPETAKWPLSEVALEIEDIFEMLVENSDEFAEGVFDGDVTEREAIRLLFTRASDELADAYIHAKEGRATANVAARRAMAYMCVFCWCVEYGEQHLARIDDWYDDDD